MRVTIAAPAKVNLWLRVGDSDASGYHHLHTLFCALDLADTLTLSAGGSGAPDLQVGHAPPLAATPDLGPVSENLVVRAARAFIERTGIAAAPRLQLIKRIPAGGGLGGGSSDAAAVLRALARLHPAALQPEELLALAGTLGSDVPFFAAGRPLAVGTGRGERLDPLPALPARPVVIVIPPFPISTADAYAWLDADRTGEPARAPGDGRAEGAASWAEVQRVATNDFEGPVFRRHPVLRELRDALNDQGAAPALLAGSGSTLFGVFPETRDAQRAAAALRDRDPALRVVVTATRTR